MNDSIMLNKRWKGAAAVLLSAASFALSSILYKIAFRAELTPAQVLAAHTWIASGLLTVYVILFQRNILRLNWSILGAMAIAGLLGKLGTNILFASSLQYLPASLATLLLYLYVVFVIASRIIFLKKKTNLVEGIASLIVLMGAFLASGIMFNAESMSLIGVFIALGAAFCYTIYNILGEVFLGKISPLAVMFYTQWFSALGLLGYLGKEVTKIPWGNPSLWLIGAAMAFICSILPFYLILYGIARIGSSKASILSTLELPLAYILSGILLGELPTWNQTLGGLFVLIGIVFSNFRKRVNIEN